MWYSILLGIIQGITEFLPISSSGHLVLMQQFMTDFQSSGLVFDIVLHAGTLIAVLAYYYKDLIWLGSGSLGYLNPKENKAARQWTLMLLIASVPAAIAGLSVEDFVEKMFENPLFTSVFLCGTGIILFIGEYLKSRSKSGDENIEKSEFSKSLLVGVAQAMALLPGISRSGSTMAAGLAVGWSRSKSARFSFLLMIPVVSGAVILKLPEIPELISNGSVQISHLLIGFFSAAISGYFSIILLLKIIGKYSFNVFAVYCMAIGLLSLIANLIWP